MHESKMEFRYVCKGIHGILSETETMCRYNFVVNYVELVIWRWQDNKIQQKELQWKLINTNSLTQSWFLDPKQLKPVTCENWVTPLFY